LVGHARSLSEPIGVKGKIQVHLLEDPAQPGEDLRVKNDEVPSIPPAITCLGMAHQSSFSDAAALQDSGYSVSIHQFKLNS
jgi:hypothetical protein